jgi:hypothetical protein
MLLALVRDLRCGMSERCQYAICVSRSRPRLPPAKLQGRNALPQNLTEPALGNDIAAVLLPPQHDFKFAHSEGKIRADEIEIEIDHGSYKGVLFLDRTSFDWIYD